VTVAKAPKPATRKINTGNGHRYELDGEKVPGVTTLLDAIPKNLAGWAAGLVAEFMLDRLELTGDHVLADAVLDDLRTMAAEAKRPTSIPDWRGKKRLGARELGNYLWELKGLQYVKRDEAAVRGTDVHNLAERLAQGETVEVAEHLVKHVDQYLAFRERWRPTNEITEFTVVNRTHRYMGTGDLICELEAAPELGVCLIDYKTNTNGPYEQTGLQLAGYRYGETIVDPDGTERPMPAIDSTLCLWIRADGFDLIPFVAEEAELRMLLYAGMVKAFMLANNYKNEDPPPWVDPRFARRLKGDALAPPRPTTTKGTP
jgi:hypothetical protein